jgi:outer membrane receptor for ferrienterochelin and colicins
MKHIFLLFFISLLSLTSIGQTISIVSKDDGEPVPEVHLIFKSINTNKEHVLFSDKDGNTNITALSSDLPVLITVSYIGFQKIMDTLFTIQSKKYYLNSEKITLNEVVVTAQYAPNSPEKAVHKIKIIDNKKIKAMGAQNLRDVLTNELNIRLSQDNVLGSSMSLQGVSGQNVKILVDGVPVTGRLNGNIDISQINMNNVERVEIIEGPLSVSYGTDALGGTINIITQKTQKETLELVSNNYYESTGQYNFTGKVGYHKGKKIVTLSGGRNYFDGWRTEDHPFYVEKSRLADSLRYKNWKPKEQYFGTLYYGHYFNKLKFGYTGDYFYEQVTNRGLPRLPYYETAFDDYYTTNRINNSLNLAGQVNKKYYLNLLVAHNYFNRIKNTYYKDLTSLDQVLTENKSDQDTSVFNNIMSRGSISTTKDSTKINTEFGYDINHETATGIRIGNQQQQITDYAIFTSAEYKPFSKLVIRPGIRIIHNTAYKAPLVPSVNVKYDFFANENKENATLRFSYARGFRSPSLKELYFYFVDINHNITGNQNLKAEQSHNFNITTSYNKLKSNKAWKLELSAFYNYIENMISLAQESSTQYSYFNIDKFQTLGLQLQNEFSIDHFKWSIGVAYIGRYNQFAEEMESEKFSYAPEARCNLFYEWHKQKLTCALFYKYTGKLPSIVLNSQNELVKMQIQDYHTLDCSVAKRLFKNKVNLSVGAKNVLDVKNINGAISGQAHASSSNSISVGMGRTYFMKIDININSKK